MTSRFKVTLHQGDADNTNRGEGRSRASAWRACMRAGWHLVGQLDAGADREIRAHPVDVSG